VLGLVAANAIGMRETGAAHADSPAPKPGAARPFQPATPFETGDAETVPGLEVASIPSSVGPSADALGDPTSTDWPARSSASGDDRSAEGDESFDCLVEPYYLVDIGSPVTGVIESLEVERGDSIEVGQVLVRLESAVERAAVEVARGRTDMDALIQSHEARVTLGEQRKRRADRLFAGDALSRDRSEEAETEATVARLELEQAREKKRLASLELQHAIALLERREIRSPVSGVVVGREMAPGEVVDDETILTVAQLDPLRVQVVLPGALFGTFRVGQLAEVQPELPGAPPQEARVVLVDRIIDAASGTFGLQLELPNETESIPGGVHCQVRFRKE
jgi:RND family efflux transporter MFP subunit